MTFNIDLTAATEENHVMDFEQVELTPADITAVEEGAVACAAIEEAILEPIAHNDGIEQLESIAAVEEGIMANEADTSIATATAIMAVAASDRVFANVRNSRGLRLTSGNEEILDPRATLVAAYEEKMGVLKLAYEKSAEFIQKLIRKVKSGFGKLVTSALSKEKTLKALKEKVSKLDKPEQISAETIETIGKDYGVLVAKSGASAGSVLKTALEVLKKANENKDGGISDGSKGGVSGMFKAVIDFTAKNVSKAIAWGTGEDLTAYLKESKTFDEQILKKKASVFSTPFSDKATCMVVSSTFTTFRVILSEMDGEKHKVKYTTINAGPTETKGATSALNVSTMNDVLDEAIKLSGTIKNGFDAGNKIGEDAYKTVNELIKKARQDDGYTTEIKQEISMAKTIASSGYGAAMDRFKLTGQAATLCSKLLSSSTKKEDK